MKVNLVDGLLQTSITINYKGQTLTIDKMVIDTDASHTHPIQSFFSNSPLTIESYSNRSE
ncbi:hypothetical protein HZF08_38555 [Paenibacillus sp. CGMCC 1.16610]|uniref:Uncharacterized protein n=1 Tax=Paenibacillus anseongense TaxID=2682845 RepID=A0ABW9UFE0_9BACL|nr:MULTISPECIES: hypothetical protein [Paenibacillus]MBA2944181.1 hypothetical protein [Paenibacillus sp. CGMCC 1.16610]MVQ38071.1 hypothetical protein [Paenibacillus anseongense]